MRIIVRMRFSRRSRRKTRVPRLSVRVPIVTLIFRVARVMILSRSVGVVVGIGR